jgi:energy-coupling factor transporter ATP-binding protein EcfA2
MERGEQFGPTSELNFPTHGLTFLLGKNGSGKSNLLDGLASLKGNERNNFPSVNLVFDWPTKELLEQWSAIVCEEYESPTGIKFLHWSSDHEVEGTNVNVQLIQLPLTLSIVEAIVKYTEIYPAPYKDLPSSEILQFFEFTDEQILSWSQHRLEKQQSKVDPYGDEIPPAEATMYIKKYDLETYALDGFLNGFRNSSIAKSLTGPFPATDPQDWSSDSSRRKLFSQTYSEFFKSITHVRISRNYSNQNEGYISASTSRWNVRLLCPIGNSTLLKSFCAEYEKSLHDSRVAFQEFDPETSFSDDQIDLKFPFDIIRPIKIGNEIYLQSNPYLIPDLCVSDYKSNPYMLLDIEKFESSIAPNPQQRLCDRIENRFLSVNSTSNTDGSMSLLVDGYDDVLKLFVDAESAITEMGMGISGLRHTRRYRNLSKDNRNLILEESFNTAINSFHIEIEWQDKHSSTWLPLSKASLGQQDVILLFLHLSYLSHVTNLHRFKLFLVDEFDKHLHPNAAEVVLEKLHEIAIESELAVIVSTHAVPRIKSNILLNRPRIYTERTLESGWFKYSAGGYVDPLAVAEILGASEIDALRIKELIVVLEGEHDQFIIEKYIRQFDEDLLERIHITHATGLDGFQGVWNNMLRLLDSKVLFVYDKRDNGIESIWKTIKNGLIVNPNTNNPYSPLKQLLKDVRQPKGFSIGDHEREKILYLLQDVCKYKEGITRVDIHGIEYDDIVDTLPIKYFWSKENQHIKSWTEAHHIYKTGRPLKKAFNIDTGKIRNVLSKISKLEDPELSKVLKKIEQILK